MTILRIDSSPRQGASNSRALTDHLVRRLGDTSVIHRDLGAEPFAPLHGDDLVALHGSSDQGSDALPHHQGVSRVLIDELLAADTLVIGIAMHNFSVPAQLKRWVDYIARAGETFRYTASGPQGLADIDTAWLVVASGGAAIGGKMDFASGYMKHICHFIGVRNVHIVDAGGSKGTPEEVIAKAQRQIDSLLPQTQVA